ncbi:MAG: ATP-dependent DNA ligase [Actinomycetota bacterium]
MALPVTPPVPPMLAKLQPELPRGEGWLYEPKWDGFRAIVFRDGKDVEIQSRDTRPFNRYFPELPPVFLDCLAKRCVVDGEIVLAGPDGLDFDSLQLRLHPAESRVRMLSKQIPTSFVAFDLLALGSRDLREQPLTKRRAELEKMLPEGFSTEPGKTQIFLTPQTDDPDEAEKWFDTFGSLGLDGVIAKRTSLKYVPGERVMVKVKKIKTADCVVVGYRLSKAGDGIGSLLLGLYDADGVLHFVGHTSSFKAQERRDLLQELQPLVKKKQQDFGPGRTPGGPSRWTQGRELPWVELKPKLVVEVSYDKMQGDRFRHATRLLRWREDKKPPECTFDQLG